MKYLQITIVLGLFFSFVIFRNLPIGDEEENIQVGAKNQIPTPQQNSGNSMMNNGQMMGKFKNGTYTGTVEDAFYGNIQVQAVITNGKITDVIFLDHPRDNGTSNFINSQAMPLLKAEAISAQSANVDIISGASDSSIAFRRSLASALNRAK